MPEPIHLSVLDRVRIASPCEVPWERMAGDDRTRYCGECRLNVYNISAMTRAEAEELILSRESRLCINFWRRADGTIITNDCPVGVRLARKAMQDALKSFAAVVAVMLNIGALVAGSTGRWSVNRVRELEPFATASRIMGVNLPSGRGGVRGRCAGSMALRPMPTPTNSPGNSGSGSNPIAAESSESDATSTATNPSGGS